MYYEVHFVTTPKQGESTGTLPGGEFATLHEARLSLPDFHRELETHNGTFEIWRDGVLVEVHNVSGPYD